MVGKSGRPIFRRTTSLTEITFHVAAPPPPIGGEFDHMLSPRNLTEVQTADFLRRCGLCDRRLAPCSDIYMYRGDIAFCSLECREQQMKQDQRKERRAAMKNGESHQPEFAAAAPEAETVAAA